MQATCKATTKSLGPRTILTMCRALQAARLVCPLRRSTLKEYRVAAWLDDPNCRLEPEVRDLLEKAAQTLASAGVRVDHEARPAFTLEKVADTFFALLQAALAGGLTPERIEHYA